MLAIDGTQGEGGGQVLRTSLALSAVTGTPFRIEGIRSARERPGLQRQHLAAVRAAAAVAEAEVDGAALGSRALAFRPRRVVGRSHVFVVEGSGSACLVLQTVLPALILASEPSKVVVEGGTHNPLAPPYEFLADAFLPLLERMGPRVRPTLVRPGFHPRGGGRIEVTIEPVDRLAPLDLLERGRIVRVGARAVVAGLPRHVAERELAVVARRLQWPRRDLRIDEEPPARGPGNVLLLEVESEHVTEVVVGFGEAGLPAERVAARAVREVERYLEAGVPVGEHLADQLLLPWALAGGGSFATVPLSLHARTQMDVVRAFLPVAFDVEARPERTEVRVRSEAR